MTARNSSTCLAVVVLATALTVLPRTTPAAEPIGPASSSGLQFPASPQIAAERFEHFRCVRCHSIGGGRGRVGPNLSRIDLRVSFLDGAAHLWNHSPGMFRRMTSRHIRWPDVRGLDLLNLVAFFTTYQYYLTRVGKPARPDRGRRLFVSKGCAKCHATRIPARPAAAGAKRMLGPNLARFGKGVSALGLAQAMWNHGPKMQKVFDEQFVPRPHFRRREMADVLAYVATLGSSDRRRAPYMRPGDPSRGLKVFRSYGCVQCHALGSTPAASRPPPGEKPAPNLGQPGARRVRDYTDLVAMMWNHGVSMWSRMKRMGMNPRPLRERELADVVALLYFANFIDPPGDATAGRAVFNARGCVTCHKTGEGPKAADGRDLSLGGLRARVGETVWDTVAGLWRAVPGMRADMRKRGVMWPKLRPGEMRDLVAFLRSPDDSAKRSRPTSKKTTKKTRGGGPKPREGKGSPRTAAPPTSSPPAQEEP